MLSNSGESGAGNARNYALEWLSEQVESCYLFFIDSGDAWEERMIEDSLLALWPSTEFNIARWIRDDMARRETQSRLS